MFQFVSLFLLSLTQFLKRLSPQKIGEQIYN
ncbi:MAG TPA: hypothetical protein DEO54_07240 [Rikenellaceae bacterium]|nr:hypothetical protein [Rikenellaceae bacterium]HBZ26017.1 hypothetical protein [Rikenellaceae bacterium]